MAKVLLFTGERSGCDKDCVRGMRENFKDFGDTVVSAPMKNFDTDRLGEVDVILVPGGDTYADDGEDQDSAMLGCLGPERLADIASAVRDQGKIYLGVCAGAFLALDIEGFGLQERIRAVEREMFGYEEFGHICGDIECQVGSRAPSGLAEAMGSGTTGIWYDNGPLFECDEGEDIVVVATFKGELDRERDKKERSKKRNEAKWKELGGRLDGTPAVIACRVGRGAVVLVSPHPELSEDCEEILPRLVVAARAWASAA